MSLLERFQRGSEFDSEGEFTLDESKAREKMARFQLVTNEEFLFLAIQAAVAAQCSSLSILLEGAAIRLTASEAALDAEAVRSIGSFLFDSSSDNVAYNLLAVASNAVEPSCLVPPLLAMVDGDLHFQVEVRSPLTALPGLLERRLVYLPCQLILNEHTMETVPLHGEARVILRDAGTSDVKLIRYGVLVAQQTLDTPISFSAVAPADHLLLDASFSHVVQDQAYQKVIDHLRGLANSHLAELARAFPAGADSRHLLSHFQQNHADPAGSALNACPIFPLADRMGCASFDEIRQQVARRGKVLTSQRKYNRQLQAPVIHLANDPVRKALMARLPANGMEDADAEYLAQITADQNRERWESSPRPTELPPGEYLFQGKAEGLTWEAAIGFLRSPGGAGRMNVLYQGKLLANEYLPDMPPGCSAVLNVRQSQVDPSWSRLDGREYRGVLKEFRDKVVGLFNAQTIAHAADVYPALSDYLLSELGRSNPAKISLTTPLFPTLEGEVLTFHQVAALEQVAFGTRMKLSDKIPRSLLPVPMLVYSVARVNALITRLGAQRVSDMRGAQGRLERLDQQMASPLPATLVLSEPPLVKTTFKSGPSHGEVALLDQPGTQIEASIMKNGVVFFSGFLPGGKVLGAAATVEAPQLTLASTWTEFEKNREYTDLRRALEQQVCKLEQQQIGNPSLLPDSRIKLIRAYSLAKEEYWNLALIPTTEFSKLVSLREVADEIEQHRHLLKGEAGLVLPGRLAVANPSKEVSRFLLDALGLFRWEEVSTALRLHHQAREFEARAVVKRVELGGRFAVKLPLEEEGTQGEVALQTSGNKTQGEVLCYVRGRFVCAKKGILAPYFSAAVQSEAFVLSSDFSDVTLPDSLKATLRDLCGRCMLEAMKLKGAVVHDQLWAYFDSAAASEKHRSRFLEGTELEVLGGGTVTLDSLREQKIRGYVSPGFDLEKTSGGMVLRLTPNQAERLAKFLGRQVSNVETILETEHEHRCRLAELPTTLPDGLYRKDFESSQLRASLGLSLERQTVGLSKDGQPLGYLRKLRMPVQAIVYGASETSRLSKELVAGLPPKLYPKLEAWAEELCLGWVQSAGIESTSANRDILLHLLLLTSNQIGSRDTTPTSTMATILWDLPLFARVDGTRVSGSALAASLQENEEPLILAASRFRVPDSALRLEPDSDELKVLNSVLGKGSLQWYKAPPLIDTADLGASVKRLVSWGLSPVSKSVSAIGRFLDREPDDEDPDKKRDPREVLVVQLKEDVQNLLGRDHFKKSNELFRGLDYGSWPLGPPIYRQRQEGAFRLNGLHAGIRWLLTEGGDARAKRALRIMLVVHWVGLVNVASEELRDVHEDEFLNRLADRMAQTFAQ